MLCGLSPSLEAANGAACSRPHDGPIELKDLAGEIEYHEVSDNRFTAGRSTCPPASFRTWGRLSDSA